MPDDTVRAAMSRSSEAFTRLVWPAIGPSFGTPIPVETVTTNPFARELDQRAGIDVWIVSVDGHMRGLASRVQWPHVDRSFDTFTVRVQSPRNRLTEYHKRRAEITHAGAIKPHYFCQAYVTLDNERLIAAAIARTADVIAAVDAGRGWHLPPNGDGSRGYAVPWDTFKTIRIVRRPEPVEALF
ncbi:MAG: hypothetical protein ACRD0P_19575 [Stackebrandtia sp.]